mgnify:CR=1 FL=1
MENLHEKQNIEMARHDERIKTIEVFVEEISKNHLPHIYDSLEQIKVRLSYYAGGIVVAVWVIEKFLK